MHCIWSPYLYCYFFSYQVITQIKAEALLSPSLNPSYQGREAKLLPLDGGRPGGGEIKREKSSAFFVVIVLFLIFMEEKNIES